MNNPPWYCNKLILEPRHRLNKACWQALRWFADARGGETGGEGRDRRALLSLPQQRRIKERNSLLHVDLMSIVFSLTSTELIAEHVGCFQDSGDRTMLERLGVFRPPDDILATCLKLVVSRGYSYFGIQNGGACRTGAKAHLTYDDQGPASNCREGHGGPWANDVYRIVPEGG